MISKDLIASLINQEIENTEYFLVDISVSSMNSIRVAIDSPSGVNIEFCVKLSRVIESSLDRDEEDFDIEVTSPGLGQPFKVLQQYEKYLGREVEVVKKDGIKLKGVLSELTGDDVVITTQKKEKIEGKKKKELVTTEHKLNIENDIKETILTISFK